MFRGVSLRGWQHLNGRENRTMTRGLKFLSLSILFLLLLPGETCPQVVLRMIGPEDAGGAWAEIIGRFQESHSGIRIDYFSGPWSTDERENMYIRSFLGGDPFELVYLDVTWTARFASKGWLLPLDARFPPHWQEEFFPGDIQAGHYGGRIYRAPVMSDVGMLYYRRDLIAKPPGTWEEMEQLCGARPHPREQFCIVFQGMQYEGLVCNFLEYLWGAGGTVLDTHGNVRLESPEAISALAFMKKMIDRGWAPRSVLTFQEQHALEFFEKGKALLMRNWPYAWNILRDSPLKGKVGIAPFLRRAGQEPAGALGGWGLGIARGTNPEPAWKFIEFATTPESQKALHFKMGAVPSRRSLFHDAEILRENPHYGEIYRSLLQARFRPVRPDYSRISSIIQKHVSAVLVGIESPREAGLTMDQAIEGLYLGQRHGWFRRLTLDFELHQTLKNTILFTALSVPLEFLLGLSFALLIHVPLRGRALSRLSVLIPWALPTAVMAMVWQWMFNNPFGVINDLLARVALISEPLDWLSTPGGAMFAAVFADVWKTTPFVAIILLGGLQSIPRELDESLSIDGAGSRMKIFHLILPLLMPFIRVALIFRVLHAAGIFDLLWVLTKGGPADSTRTLSLYIYDLAFRFDEIGYGIFLTLLFIASLILISFLIVRGTTLKYERIKR